jgi:hypothetical protein
MAVGLALGTALGADVGVAVGKDDGEALGVKLGAAEGAAVGAAVGLLDGGSVGTADGYPVGAAVGADDGTAVGASVGNDDGTAVGAAVGAAVGSGVQINPTQELDWQSLPASHFSPVEHLSGHVMPPQSTSVSKPFCVPSVHGSTVGMLVGASVGSPAHLVLVQVPDVQSLAASQTLPIAH